MYIHEYLTLLLTLSGLMLLDNLVAQTEDS